MATEDKGSVPSEEKTAIPECKGTRKRVNSPAMFFKTWATPIGTAIAVGTLVWGVISFTLQQQLAQQQALDQQQQMTLQTYLDDMTNLLFDDKLGSQAVADKATSAEAAIIARAKTLTALRLLTDPQRKATVVQFLYQSDLIGYYDSTNNSNIHPIVDLEGADLRGADLARANLSGADLSGVDLSCIDLTGKTVCTDLSDADLTEANLHGANLTKANLSGAGLLNADLGFASLLNAEVTKEQLVEALTLQGAIMPDGLICHRQPKWGSLCP